MRTITGLRVDLYSKFPEKFTGVSLKQGDPTTLIISVYENSAAYDLTGCDFLLNAELSDGSAHIQTAGMTALVNVLTVVLDDEIYDGSSGLLQLELIITKTAIPISTFIMSMDLEPKLIATGTVATAAADALITVITESLRAPYIQDGNWWYFNTTTKAFADSGIPASAVAEPYVTSQKNVAGGIAGLDADKKIGVAQLPLIPRLSFINAGIKDDVRVTPFDSIYQAFNVQTKSPGYLYALAKNYSTDTQLKVYKSIDGGISWTVMGTIAYNAAGGERLEAIFVIPYNENILILKSSGETQRWVLTFDKTLTLLGTLDIGNRKWHSNMHNIDSRNQHVVMGEYSNATVPGNAKLWYSGDSGVTWMDRTVAIAGTTIRHIHCVQADPYVGATLWLATGDTDALCQIWKTPDYGYSWTKMAEGSQEFRTLGFVFTPNYIYWAMDNESAIIETKIFKAPKTDLSARQVVGRADNNMPIYGITRTFYPPGFLMFPNHEPTSTYDYVLRIQFFDFATERLSTAAEIPKFSRLATEYYGFNASSRYQCRTTGVIAVEAADINNLDEYTMTGGENTGKILCRLSM